MNVVGATISNSRTHEISLGTQSGTATIRVPVRPGDTAETLAERILATEHSLYPRAVAEFLSRIRG